MEAAMQMLWRAVKLDSDQKYSEAKVCYEEGIELLLKTMPTLQDKESKQKIRGKIQNYMKRAEELKEFVTKDKKAGKFHTKIEIIQNQRGFSYANLFSKYITEDLTVVTIKDAYIRAHHQIVNLVRFSELLMRRAKNLKEIRLTTEFSDALHDREIVFDNGWIIKIGRGLDYFKSPNGRMSVGTFDMDLRECHETTVDIYDTR